MAVSVTAASAQDRDAAAEVVAQACTKVTGLKKRYADASYGGKCATALEQTHGISVEIVRHPGHRSTGKTPSSPCGPRSWPRASPSRPSTGASSALMRETSARRRIAHHDRSNGAPLAWVWPAEARVLATLLAP